MSLGLVGRKVGMTRIFADDGNAVPVTVLDMSDNRVTQIKTPDNDGYAAVQVAFGKRRGISRCKSAGWSLCEGRCRSRGNPERISHRPAALGDLKVGSAISVEIFQVGQKIDVTGSSKGKGFSGVIKRHHFTSNRATHGNSRSHNVPGSIGMAQDPGRVFPGKRMAGHLGDVTKTVQLLEVARIDVARQLLLVRGAVPGAKNGNVIVLPSVKAPAAKGDK